MRHASLFSGIGGPEIAAAMMGWSNVFHCEINPFGRHVLDYWFPESVSYEDITKTSFKEWRGKVDILTGGFPCQPFSYAGNRGGQKDARYLWPEMLRAIDEIRPSWVVGENVAGITTMVEGGLLADLGSEESLFPQGAGVHRYELQQTFTIERICRDLEHLGYSVQPMLIPAAAVGAPHRRDRVFIIAYAPNADNVGENGGSGEDEGKGKEERLQERNKVQLAGEPDNHRREVKEAAANTAGKRRGEVLQYLQPKLADGTKPLRSCRKRTAADANVQRLDESSSTEEPRTLQRLDSQANTCWRDGSLKPERRWSAFPTVSPVHRGNDGLPFTLDDLTVPATRWRTESLKAYGNAIVPQVMYRIFQAIEVAS